jgi:cytochrome c553
MNAKRLSAMLAALTVCTYQCAAEERPEWAFFVPAAEAAAPAPAAMNALSTQSVPGSRQTFTLGQVMDVLNPPDWYPEEHPAMPAIVAHGLAAGVDSAAPLLPCALCHLPNGAGHVESASLAGLPVEYLIRQFADFRSGARHINVGSSGTAQLLTALKSAYTDDQARSAAGYFAALEPRSWIEVRETRTVPVSIVNPNTLMRTALPGAGKEPLGIRIVELPQSETGLRYRDSHSGFVAYVPIGSIARGRSLVAGAGGRIPACVACHGSTLNGLGEIPPLAGRPPTYLVRQLWNYQSGDRAGSMAAPMQAVVAHLHVDDMVAMAAYLASLPPAGH